jgi:hypothetical protein
MHREIDRKLIDAAYGRIKILVIMAPVQHGKTALASVGNIVWLLGRWPQLRVGAFSYASDFAEGKVGRPTRNLMRRIGPQLFGVTVDRTSSSVSRWDIVDSRGVPTGGGFYCGGVDTGIAGHKLDRVIIDDPCGLMSDADRPAFRDEQWRWYTEDLRQRFNPRTTLVLIASRWNQDDLTGRLIEYAIANDERIEVIDLPAIALEPTVENAYDAVARQNLKLPPPQPYRDALGRKPGEPVCPELRPLAFLESQRKNSTPRIFAANYQGRPQAAGGAVFKAEWFRQAVLEGGVLKLLDRQENVVEAVLLEGCHKFAMCDPATGKQAENPAQGKKLAYFVIAVAAMTPRRNIVILDVVRTRDSVTEHLGHLNMVWQKWRPAPIGVESVGYQSTLIQYAVQMGLPCTEIKPGRDSKEARAEFAAARYQVGSVFHLRGAAWLKDLENELVQFPAGFKDQVDTVSYCVAAVALSEKQDSGATGHRIGGYPAGASTTSRGVTVDV